VYRSAGGFRASAAVPQTADSAAGPIPVSVRTLLDSAELALPDTSEFSFRPYRVRYTPDYVARPTVGYERDNFGRGFFGGTAISLSDMLGNHTLVFAGSVNGRLSEAQVLGVYINQSRRLNWATGFSQDPIYFYAPSSVDPISGGPPDIKFVTRLRRYVVRDAFGAAYYPFNRFRRLEFGLHFVNIGQATLELSEFYDNAGNFYGGDLRTVDGPSIGYVQPSVALVHDNALFGYVGPFAGVRSRFQLSPTFGTWHFHSGLADYRRYLFARPFTLAFRTLFFGRWGRDADDFPLFLGNTDLLRGYTAGSFRDNECVAEVTTASRTGCAELDQLIGSKLAVANVELRFPLVRNVVFGFLPVGLPPIEAALFYDLGVAWDDASVVKWQRDPAENPVRVRTPLKSYGASIRANLLGIAVLRFDYTKPLDRPRKDSYWTVSLGPTF
ncbi:MAG: BamA/TamA family outer membrane protein, partial [bacterium]